MKKVVLILTIISIFSMLSFAALDLKFSSNISIAPAMPAAGTNVTFAVGIKAIGAAADNFKCAFGIDAAKIGERTFAHIEADASRTISFSWVAVAGTHKVWFKLDPENKTGDINIQNNYIEKNFTISRSDGSLSTSLDQFVIKHPELTSEPFNNLTTKPNLKFDKVEWEVIHGESYNNLIFKIVIGNSGGKASVETLLGMNISSTLTAQKPSLIPAIKAHGIFTLTRETKCLPTSRTFTFILDVNNVNAETNENDNIWSQIIGGCQ